MEPRVCAALARLQLCGVVDMFRHVRVAVTLWLRQHRTVTPRHETGDGFRTCSLNWFILVSPKSCRALKRWKSPSLKRKQMSGCFRVLILRWSISPKNPFPSCVWGSRSRRPVGTDGSRVETVTRQHLRLRVITRHPLATTQPPSSSPSQLQAHSQPQTTYTHMLLGPVTESVSWNPALLLTTASRINLLLTFRNNEHDSPDSGSFQHRLFLKLVQWLPQSAEQERIQSYFVVHAKEDDLRYFNWLSGVNCTWVLSSGGKGKVQDHRLLLMCASNGSIF